MDSQQKKVFLLLTATNNLKSLGLYLLVHIHLTILYYMFEQSLRKNENR